VSDVSLKTANRVEPKSRGGTRKVAGYVDPVAARETESNVLKGGWGGGGGGLRVARKGELLARACARKVI